MLHQLFGRGFLQQPLKAVLSKPRAPAKGPFRRLSESHFFQRGCAKPATSSQLLKKEPQNRGRACPWPGGGLAVWKPVDRERQKHLPTSWSKGLVAKRGISTACRGVRRDSSSTPRESGCDEGRKTPRGEGGKSNSHALYRARDSSSSHWPPSNRGSSSGCDGGGGTSEGVEKSPAQSLSGIWATSALPDQNLSRTRPAKLCPTKSPPPPDSANN